ncbi:MAG: hypothetical protein R2817_03270 [Flavobacteriales bacterium]
MKHFLLAVLLLIGTATAAQNTIYSHAIGNWRNGPSVYITPVIETTEKVGSAGVRAQVKEQYPELRDIPAHDLDVLLFGTQEEAELSRRTLQAKYTMRKLPVVLLPTATAPRLAPAKN